MSESQRRDDEENPRCIVSDPAQPHNFSHRAAEKVKHDCTGCGKSEISLEILNLYHCHYYCTLCDLEFHKECLEKPSKILHPYHPQHPLVFTFLNYETGTVADTSYVEYQRFLSLCRSDDYEYPETIETEASIMFDICTWCGNDLNGWFYRCKICNFCLDLECASKFPPLTIQNPKSHHHSLALLPRPLSFPCHACGVIYLVEPSYACYQCSYLVHQSCIDLPRVIKITRHPHRLYHTPYLPAKVVPCRICYRNVDIKYGQYSCNHEDCSYVAHSRCATHGKIWDGEELEWESEISDKAEDIAPYKKISGGLIEHCWHENHYLKLEKYDGSKNQCQACMRAITSHDFYRCIECEFYLHEVCANLPRKLDHAFHKHPLFMDPYPISESTLWMLTCSVCFRLSTGMKYRCRKEGCENSDGSQFKVDVNCILVPECSKHESHTVTRESDEDHSLFIFTFISQSHCPGCKGELDGYYLECVSCEFAICYRCATIPHEIYHKYDEDPLTLCYGEDGVDDTYWCEACEGRLDPEEWFYMNSKRCTTIHYRCLFGDFAYMKPGYTVPDVYCIVEVVRNDTSSRPMCLTCHLHCPNLLYLKVHKPNGTEVVICSLECYTRF